ncbi:MAG TPA: hypothetical protein VKP04_04230, partial [Ktedonobacteraceae bacterium]|nr:hypothetical protein [Ktedonobacteraceae bacterium]
RKGGVTIRNLQTGEESFSPLDSLVVGQTKKEVLESHSSNAAVGSAASIYGKDGCKEGSQ